jgi:hypothetical protein
MYAVIYAGTLHQKINKTLNASTLNPGNRKKDVIIPILRKIPMDSRNKSGETITELYIPNS